MTTGLLICGMLLAATATDPSSPEAIQKYLSASEAASKAAIAAQELLIKNLPESTPLAQRNEAQLRLKQLREAPVRLLPLPLPPGKDEIGIFEPATPGDGRGGRSVDALEVIDGENAILRVWYAPAPSSDDKNAPAEDPTFVDLWVHGVDTSDFKPGRPVKLTQVFQVAGTKTFGTTCGGRSMVLLEPVDIEPYRPAK